MQLFWESYWYKNKKECKGRDKER